MEKTIAANERRFWVPEVVQTSAMDCGPAALKALLEGFGLPIDYGRLREACQTDVDGASIDTVEDVALRLGLACRQVLAPVDHLFIASAHLLPALVIVLQPTGATHFVVVWRVVGSWVQIMDPAQGRRWLTRSELTRSIYRHHFVMAAQEWRSWAASEGFCDPLRTRMQQLGLSSSLAAALLAQALADPSWRPLAALDATIRFVKALVTAGGVAEAAEIVRLVEGYFVQASRIPDAAPPSAATIPATYWSVLPQATPAEEIKSAEELLTVRGAVLLTVTGRDPVVAPSAEPSPARAVLLPGLRAALTPPLSPARAAVDALRADGLLAPGVLALAVLVAALGVTLEATVLRGLMDFHTWLVRDSLRLTLAVGIFSFAILLFLLEAALTTLSLRLGRRVETRLRIALLTKIPQIEERYFHSRLISDMAYRAYSLTQLHSLPGIGVDLLRQSAQLLFTTIGVVWLAPQSALLAFAMLGAVMAVALFSQPIVGERDLRVRTHTSALSRFYLDALLGLLPIRSHSAERIVRREHEMLLTTWMRALRELANLELLLQGSVALIGLGGACALVLSYIGGGGEASGVLLLLYWALNLPVLGQAFVTNAQQYPRARNHLLRLLEPLGAPTKTDAPPEKEPLPDPAVDPAVDPEPTALPNSSWTQGVAVVLQGVTAVAAGHPILHDLNLTIQPGEHIALVGTSGAGKSSLAGLLLGWHRPTQGEIWVDGQRLTETRLQSLRRMTAWVDPAVLLWNRSLSANLLYGVTEEEQEKFALNDALTLADLDVVAARLAEGLATGLGEGGGLISGGEGQRVRFARALLRPGVRLAILDEPFRGLESSQRRQLLARARQHWRSATLLCITHDVADTQTFDRVIVLDNGRIVEEGAPQQLADDPNSHYRGWLDLSAASWQTLWNAEGWRRLHLEQGQLHEL